MKTILDLLKEDHEKLRNLCEKISNTTERASKTRTFAFIEFRELLQSHSMAEEEIFYSELEEKSSVRPLVLEGHEEHHVADVLIEELSLLPVESERWTAKFEVLRESLEHHIEEEENEIFEKAREHLSEFELIKFGKDFVRCKTMFLEEEPKNPLGIEPVIS